MTRPLWALAGLDEELALAGVESSVEPTGPKLLILNLVCDGNELRGLVDTGSEINLISEKAVLAAGFHTQDLDRPTKILSTTRQVFDIHRTATILHYHLDGPHVGFNF